MVSDGFLSFSSLEHLATPHLFGVSEPHLVCTKTLLLCDFLHVEGAQALSYLEPGMVPSDTVRQNLYSSFRIGKWDTKSLTKSYRLSQWVGMRMSLE